MSQHLHSYLDAERLAECAKNDKALMVDRGLAAPRFRVEADWNGGGFGYTIPAANAEDAYLWGAEKARYHRDAEITVTPAYPAEADALVQGQGFIGGVPL